MTEAPELPPDILEQILIGFDAMDLIRFKSVCKSWHSFISSDRFSNAHLNDSYNNVRNNNEVGDTRIVMSKFGVRYYLRHDFDNNLYYDRHVLGSSNGLVCIYNGHATEPEIFIANPLTRKAKKLQRPQITKVINRFCWGFGYDSFTDDYKVVLGLRIGGQDGTFFHVLSLKSNEWIFIGKVMYRFVSRSGILCNGALHWFMNDQNYNRVILSFDLSKEEFKEIPQPDDPDCEHMRDASLGITENCLCIFDRYTYDTKWVMKYCNGELSWKLYDHESMFQPVYFLRNMSYNRQIKRSFFEDDIVTYLGICTGAPVFVPSLVSPHVSEKPKRKRQTKIKILGNPCLISNS